MHRVLVQRTAGWRTAQRRGRRRRRRLFKHHRVLLAALGVEGAEVCRVVGLLLVEGGVVLLRRGRTRRRQLARQGAGAVPARRPAGVRPRSTATTAASAARRVRLQQEPAQLWLRHPQPVGHLPHHASQPGALRRPGRPGPGWRRGRGRLGPAAPVVALIRQRATDRVTAAGERLQTDGGQLSSAGRLRRLTSGRCLLRRLRSAGGCGRGAGRLGCCRRSLRPRGQQVL